MLLHLLYALRTISRDFKLSLLVFLLISFISYGCGAGELVHGIPHAMISEVELSRQVILNLF